MVTPDSSSKEGMIAMSWSGIRCMKGFSGCCSGVIRPATAISQEMFELKRNILYLVPLPLGCRTTPSVFSMAMLNPFQWYHREIRSVECGILFRGVFQLESIHLAMHPTKFKWPKMMQSLLAHDAAKPEEEVSDASFWEHTKLTLSCSGICFLGLM